MPASMQPETIDRIHGLLSDSRRRYLLYLFRESSTSRWPVDVLARHLVAWEQGRPASAVSADEHERVTVSLVHNHLPRLAECDIVEYDAEHREVVPLGRLEEIAPFVDRAYAIESERHDIDTAVRACASTLEVPPERRE